MSGTPLSSTPPPLPPPTEDDLAERLRLLRSPRVGAVTFKRLMSEHGDARKALSMLPHVARAAGVENYRPCSEAAAQAELKAGRQAGAKLIAYDDPAYPGALHELHDAPPLLWAIGDVGLLSRPMVAVVGARNASSLGTRMARRIAQDLSQAGFVVVSGLARGVDAAAHLAALRFGTIAVQAGGVDVLYPAENAGLAQDIGRQGLRLSEMPMNLHPQARHFPARNRIISGLARAVVVVEAAAKSGSLITARGALDQNREVLAVPGHPFDARAAGCNMLIRDGATLVRSAADIMEALGVPDMPDQPAAMPESEAGAKTRTLRETSSLHSEILARLGPSPIAEDQLIRDLAIDPNGVAPALVDLELSGKIRRQAGGLLAKVV